MFWKSYTERVFLFSINQQQNVNAEGFGEMIKSEKSEFEESRMESTYFFFLTHNPGEAGTYFYTSNCKYNYQLNGENSCWNSSNFYCVDSLLLCICCVSSLNTQLFSTQLTQFDTQLVSKVNNHHMKLWWCTRWYPIWTWFSFWGRLKRWMGHRARGAWALVLSTKCLDFTGSGLWNAKTRDHAAQDRDGWLRKTSHLLWRQQSWEGGLGHAAGN